MARGIEGLQHVIHEVCKIVSLVYRATDPECRNASDGFCYTCPHGVAQPSYRQELFRHDEKTIEWLRLAVVEKLKRDGIAIPEGYDPETGVEIQNAQGHTED